MNATMQHVPHFFLFLFFSLLICALTACNGNGGSAHSGGAVYSPGSGGTPADSGSASGTDGTSFTAQDLLDLSNSGSDTRIVDLLTAVDEETVSTTPVDLSATDLGLPAGCSIVIELTIDGRTKTYTAQDENGNFHFDLPFVVSGSEVTVVMDVYDGSGDHLLTGSTSRTVSGSSEILSLTLTPLLYTISFDTDGGSAIAARKVLAGDSLALPPPPSKAGFAFAGWYADSVCSSKFDVTQAVSATATLYAKWSPILNTVTAVSGSQTDLVAAVDGGTYLVNLNNYSWDAPDWSAGTTINNFISGGSITVYVDIQGDNTSIGDNHGGFKLNGEGTSPASTIHVVFCTSSSGAFTFGHHRTDVLHLLDIIGLAEATVSIQEGCTVSDMSIGGTSYTDWDSFISAARTRNDVNTMVSFTITQNP